MLFSFIKEVPSHADVSSPDSGLAAVLGVSEVAVNVRRISTAGTARYRAQTAAQH
jgi:hypothetical protein